MLRKFSFFALVLILAACAPIISSSPLATPSLTSTIAVPTSTFTPTVPPTETPTPTSTMAYPVSMNTPWPKPDKIIKADNIDQLVPLASWGYGLISDAVVSPDQSKFVVATFTGFYIYDSQTLKISSTVATRSPVLTVTFSPDGKVLATGHSDNTVQLWDVSKQKLLQTLSFSFDESKVAPFDGVEEIRFTPDGKLLEVTGQLAFEEYVKLWEISSGKIIGTFDKISSCNLKIAPNGSEYALVTLDAIQIFSIVGGSIKNEFKIRNANQILYSPDGRIMAVVVGSVVNLVNTADGLLIKNIPGKSLEFLQGSNNTFITSNDGNAQIWLIEPDGAKVTPGKSFSGTGIGDAGRLSCGTLAKNLIGQDYRTSSYMQNGAFSTDGNYIALLKKELSKNSFGKSANLLIYRVNDGSLHKTVKALPYSIPVDCGRPYDVSSFNRKVLFVNDQIITFSFDIHCENVLRIWDIEKNSTVLEINPIRPALPVAFSPDNKSLVSYSPNGGKNLFVPLTPTANNYFNTFDYNEFELALWNIAQGSVNREYYGFKGFRLILWQSDAWFSSDGKQFTYNGRPSSYTWNIDNSQPIQSAQAGGPRTKASFDKRRSASVSGDGFTSATLNLLDATNGNLIKTLDSGYSVSFDFSPNGAFLVSVNQTSWTDTIRVFSSEDGSLLRTINTPYHDPAYVAFSPDGTMLAIAFKGVVQIWGIDPSK